jgi:hypothetical protein
LIYQSKNPEVVWNAFTYAKNGLGTNKLDELVLGRADSVALSIGLEVAQVTNMANLVGGSTVGLTEGVDWRKQVSFLAFG